MKKAELAPRCWWIIREWSVFYNVWRWGGGGEGGEVHGCKFSFPERCWAWQPRDCSLVSTEDCWGQGWLLPTCPIPLLSHFQGRLVLRVTPASWLLIWETASTACNVDAHPQADGLRQLMWCSLMRCCALWKYGPVQRTNQGKWAWAMSVSYRQSSFPWGRWPGGRLFSTERRECFKKEKQGKKAWSRKS